MARTLCLRPGARPLRRGAGQVQFGRWPGGGVVLAGLTEAETAALLSLTVPVQEQYWIASARAAGVDALRVERLVEALDRHDLLARPGRGGELSGGHRVLVEGGGRLAELLAGLLPQPLPGDRTRPALVVLLAAEAAPRHLWRPWWEAGVPHLPVLLGEQVVLGPVVTPPEGPCLGCLDLHRTDRDPAWPRLLAQLVRTAPGEDPARGLDESAVAAAAAATAAVVRAHLGGTAAPPGISWRLGWPWPQVAVQAWTAHPACPGHGRRPPGPPGGG